MKTPLEVAATSSVQRNQQATKWSNSTQQSAYLYATPHWNRHSVV